MTELFVSGRSWHRRGHEIGVGLGVEGVDSKDAGKVLIVSMLKPSLEIAKELKDANGAITCISFSPDGECMAVGSADSNIYVYDTLNSFVLKCTCVCSSPLNRKEPSKIWGSGNPCFNTSFLVFF